MYHAKLFSLFFALLILMVANVVSAQTDMMMDNGMMMSGWAMLACVVFGILLFVALVLAILALLKYLFSNK